LNDLKTFTDFTKNKEIVDSIILEKRQTNKKDKNDLVFITVKCSNSNIMTIQKAKLTFNFYDKGGWVLDKVDLDETDKILSPLKGASDDLIIEDLTVKGFGRGKIAVMVNNVDTAKISGHTTSLVNFTDIVTVDVVKKSPFFEFSAKINLEYVFNKELGIWEFSTIEKIYNVNTVWKILGLWEGGEFNYLIKSVDVNNTIIAQMLAKQDSDWSIAIKWTPGEECISNTAPTINDLYLVYVDDETSCVVIKESTNMEYFLLDDGYNNYYKKK